MHDLSKADPQPEHPPLLNTSNVKPTTYKTKNGLFSILKDGTVSLDLSAKRRRKFRISADGKTVPSPHQMLVTNAIDGSEKSFAHDELPSKYLSVYKYAYGILNLIKSKTPKATLENMTGRFILMMNEPNPNYQAHFSNGLVLNHTLHSPTVSLLRHGQLDELSLKPADLDRLDPDTREQVRTALRYLDLLSAE